MTLNWRKREIMFKHFKNIVEKDTEYKVLDATVEYREFTPKNSSGEFIETLIIVELELKGIKQFAHILQTYSASSEEIRCLYIDKERGGFFDHLKEFNDKTELFNLMDEEDITIDELAESIYNMNNKPLPNSSIKGVSIYFKLNNIEIPEFMELEYWENRQGAMEMRFIVSNKMQYEWLSELLDVGMEYLVGYEYVTLYN